MTTTKKLGIWMDHSTARLMESTNDITVTKTIESKFTHQSKEESLNKSEHIMHNKEQHQQAEYYKKLGESIRNYNSVLLFGPTTAKDELYNVLKADHNFEKIKIEVKQSDKMTDKQQQAFVNEHFANAIS
jgi:hypothetical protein